MKSLYISPMEHDISLEVNELEEGHSVAIVRVKLGSEVRGQACLIEDEARKVGQWFIKLADAIKKANK